MYITDIKLFNFKSYKHQIIKENFSPGLNIFLGSNGSGKTTLFDAIDSIFYLKNKSSTTLNISDLSKYSFKKKGSLSMIEISFDNTSRFFPFQNNKITIKRVFGLNVDKFLIGKHSIFPNQFFHFLNLKQVYVDALYFKIRQGMHLEFKNSTCKKRLKIFQSGIGLYLLEMFEKKSIKYLSKLNFYKKELLSFINKLKNNEKLFSKKIKWYRKYEKLSNNFIMLQKIFFHILNNISKKKLFNLNIGIYRQTSINSMIINRLFYAYEELNYMTLRKTTEELKMNNKINIIRKIPPTDLENVCFFLNGSFEFLLSIFQILNYLEHLVFFCSKYLDEKKKKKKIKKKKTLNISENFSKKWDFLCGKIYNFFLIFQLNLFWGEKKPSDILLIIKKIHEEIHSLKLNNVILKKKGQFLWQEISIEIQTIKLKLYNYEDQLKNLLGDKTIRGVRAILKITRILEQLKNKVFGLLIDLVLVHKYFYKAAESILRKHLKFIVVKDKDAALEIIKIFKNRIKNKVDFIVSEYQINNKSYIISRSINSFAFPIIIAFYFRPVFQILFKKLLKNTFFIKNFTGYNSVCLKKNTRIVSLDGDILCHDGNVYVGSFYLKKSIFEVVNLLKKNRLFFDWLNKSETTIKNINQFLEFVNCRSKSLENFLTRILKLTDYNNIGKIPKNEKIYTLNSYIFEIKKAEKFFIFENRTKKNLKIFKNKTQEQKLLINNMRNRVFCFWYNKMLSFIFVLIECTRFNNSIVKFFSIDVQNFFFHYDFKCQNLSKNPKINNEKIVGNFVGHQKLAEISQKISHRNVTDLLFFKNYIMFLTFKNLDSNQKKSLNLPIYNSLSKKKKMFCLILNITQKTIRIEIINTLKRILYQKKIFFKIIHKYNELETNILVINQTFDILSKKKQENLKFSLTKTAKRFKNLFRKNVFGANASIIVKYKTRYWFDKIDKKKYKNITGITILAGFENQENVYLLEQMSSGQGSLVCFVFFLALREINPVLIYIFDEIDANLDFNNSLLVSYIIKQTSTYGIQFLLSTFGQNFIINGDKWFGILNTKKGSLIQNIHRKTALKFSNVDKK
nr:structural maintenance of chromosomes 3 [Cryptomonas sp.]